MPRMKTIMFVVAVLAAACGGAPAKDQPIGNTEPSGATTTTTDTPASSMSSGIECAKEIALTCDAGTADGCVDGRTQYHVCVADGETVGPTCDKEIAKVCGAGQVDACMATPVYAAGHLCVFAK
jgi:hypothetical protein